MATEIDICNDALAELPSAPITAMDERSLEARECSRVYQPALRYLLEQHDWGFASKRVILAAVTNDRRSEYAYAYAVPADLGTPRKLIPDFAGTGLGIPVEGPFTPPYYEVWSGFGVVSEPFFQLEAGVIYTSLENATLEYGVSTVSEAVMPQMFAYALSMEIAARIAMPIKKDRQLKADLVRQAEAAKDRAMADDQNRSPRWNGTGYTSEVAMVRF